MGAGKGERGFTLMELIIVLAILAAFTAMAVPLAGRLEARGRERETERRLEQVREALLGPRGAFDAGGRRLLAGYAGDLGGVPPLRRSVWNDLEQRWDWDPPFVNPFANEQEAAAYWASGMGQPRNLWAPLPPLLAGGAPDPLAARWRGPYLHEPRDEFPANAEHLRWSDTAQLAALTEVQRRAAGAANREIEMRQTAGRLADAWGRSLLFFYEQPGPAGEAAEIFQGSATAQTTIHIVSEGADMRSTPPAFSLALPENRDNLVLTITPPERLDAAREAETENLLQAVRQALVGAWGPVDRLGRPVFGGYVGDQGRWPELFVWRGTPPAWQLATVTTDPTHGAVFIGQPRGLWTRDTSGDGTLAVPPDLPLPLPPDPATAVNVLLGFGWRGPYLLPPPGTGEAEVLRDAWGVPLQFRLSHAGVADPPPEQTLTIISAGPDGTPGTGDDLTEVVPRRFDVRQGITLWGTVVNETTTPSSLRVRLHASPALQPAVPEPPAAPQLVSPGETWPFSLTVSRSSAGLRLLELVEYHDADPDPLVVRWEFLRRRDWTMVHISSGGTAAAERDPLVLRARP
jgi:prepilin-type N-terminal cleavage/methylation domain-containing protein